MMAKTVGGLLLALAGVSNAAHSVTTAGTEIISGNALVLNSATNIDLTAVNAVRVTSASVSISGAVTMNTTLTVSNGVSVTAGNVAVGSGRDVVIQDGTPISVRGLSTRLATAEANITALNTAIGQVQTNYATVASVNSAVATLTARTMSLARETTFPMYVMQLSGMHTEYTGTYEHPTVYFPFMFSAKPVVIATHQESYDYNGGVYVRLRSLYRNQVTFKTDYESSLLNVIAIAPGLDTTVGGLTIKTLNIFSVVNPGQTFTFAGAAFSTNPVVFLMGHETVDDSGSWGMGMVGASSKTGFTVGTLTSTYSNDGLSYLAMDQGYYNLSRYDVWVGEVLNFCPTTGGGRSECPVLPFTSTIVGRSFPGVPQVFTAPHNTAGTSAILYARVNDITESGFVIVPSATNFRLMYIIVWDKYVYGSPF